jgi:hypothetical protein
LAFFNFNRYKQTKQQKAIIEEQKKKVEQSEKYKEQFLANMSHEIRTPMHAISGMVKILERNDHPASQDVFLDVMKTSSDNLVVILNDVLDLSKIEAGKLDIESIPIYPSQMDSKKLFVGNLSYGMTEDLLRETFAAAGTVESAQIISDKFSGRSKGFGFVEMSSDEEAQNAISMLNEKEVEGRAMIVNIARPKTERPPREY